MTNEYPAYNLEDALASEARSAMQLWLNLEYTSGVSHFGGGTSKEWVKSDWPFPTTVQYWDGEGHGTRYVRFESIYNVRTGAPEWETEEVHDRVIDIAYERKYNVPSGVSQEVSYDFTMTEVKTREQATSLGLENELKLRLGGISHPAGVENVAKVKASVEQKYGTTQTFAQRFADKTTIQGPANLILRGERARSQVSQVVKSVPEFEYKIIMGMREGGDGKEYYREVEFGSKAEFNAFIQGRAPNTVGVVYEHTALVTKDQLRTWEMAPVARKNRQPDATITNHHHPLVFNTAFDDQIEQGVIFYDADTGKRVNPFDYQPGKESNG